MTANALRATDKAENTKRRSGKSKALQAMKASRAVCNASSWISATLESPFALPTPPERPAQHPPAMRAELFQHADSNGMPYTRCGQAKFPRKNGVQSTQTRQRKRCAAAPHGRRGQGASRPARPGLLTFSSATQPRRHLPLRSTSLHRFATPIPSFQVLLSAPQSGRSVRPLWQVIRDRQPRPRAAISGGKRPSRQRPTPPLGAPVANCIGHITVPPNISW